MTYREYISQSLSGIGIDSGQVEVILINAQIEGDDDVIVSIAKAAIYNEFPLLVRGISSVSEGGVSISYDVQGMKLWYSLFCKKLGLPDLIMGSQSGLTDLTNRW